MDLKCPNDNEFYGPFYIQFEYKNSAGCYKLNATAT